LKICHINKRQVAKNVESSLPYFTQNNYVAECSKNRHNHGNKAPLLIVRVLEKTIAEAANVLHVDCFFKGSTFVLCNSTAHCLICVSRQQHNPSMASTNLKILKLLITPLSTLQKWKQHV